MMMIHLLTCWQANYLRKSVERRADAETETEEGAGGDEGIDLRTNDYVEGST